MNATAVYKVILEKLERELSDIDEELTCNSERELELKQRKVEVNYGIDGIRQMLKGRI